MLRERDAEWRTFRTHGLAHQPTYAVSPHGVESLAGNRKPDMQGSLFCALDEIHTHRERTTDFSATVEHAVECCIAPERLSLLHLPFVADRELLAPPGAAARKNCASGLCGHAGPESMRIPALPVVRLKRPLHTLTSVRSRIVKSKKAYQGNTNGPDLQPERTALRAEISCSPPPDVLLYLIVTRELPCG